MPGDDASHEAGTDCVCQLRPGNACKGSEDSVRGRLCTSESASGGSVWAHDTCGDCGFAQRGPKWNGDWSTVGK